MYITLIIVLIFTILFLIFTYKILSNKNIKASPVLPIKIPENIRQEFPEMEEKINKIDEMIDAIQECFLPEIFAATKPLTPMITWKLQIYMQVTIYRVNDITDSIINSFDNQRYSCAYILLKALNENCALIYYSSKKLERLIQQGDFKEVNLEINHLIFGNKRDDFFPYKARNVLTCIDKVTRDVPNFRINYNHLCEYAHPNHDGLFGLYARQSAIDTINISRLNGNREANGTKVINFLWSLLGLTIVGYSKMNSLLKSISDLAIADLREHGEDITAYIQE